MPYSLKKASTQQTEMVCAPQPGRSLRAHDLLCGGWRPQGTQTNNRGMRCRNGVNIQACTHAHTYVHAPAHPLPIMHTQLTVPSCTNCMGMGSAEQTTAARLPITQSIQTAKVCQRTRVVGEARGAYHCPSPPVTHTHTHPHPVAHATSMLAYNGIPSQGQHIFKVLGAFLAHDDT